MSEKLQTRQALDWAEASEASVMQMYGRGWMTVIANEEKPKPLSFH